MLFVDSILYKVILVPPIDATHSIWMLGTLGEASEELCIDGIFWVLRGRTRSGQPGGSLQPLEVFIFEWKTSPFSLKRRSVGCQASGSEIPSEVWRTTLSEGLS